MEVYCNRALLHATRVTLCDMLNALKTFSRRTL